jgi:Signal transduction histidine kinase
LDTKSTRFKYTKISKAICLLLATLLFSLGTWCAVELGIGSLTYGGDKYFSGAAAAGKQSFTATPVFERVLRDDASHLQELASYDEAGYAKALAGQQKKTVEEVVDQYIARQNEVKQNFAAPEDASGVLEDEIFVRNPTVSFTFHENDYDLEIELEYKNMALPEKDIRRELNHQYDRWEREELESYRDGTEAEKSWLNENASVHYYVRSADGSVYTNLPEKPTLRDVRSNRIAAVREDEQALLQGIDYLEGESADVLLPNVPEGAAVRFWIDDPAETEGDLTLFSALHDDTDDYFAAHELYEVMKDRPAGWILAIMIFSYLAALALFIRFLLLVGHVNTGDGVETRIAAIDKVPGDVHFLVSAVLFSLCLGLPLAGMVESFTDALSVWPWLPLGGALTTAVCFLLLAEWLASVCRTVKSGRGFWKHTLLGQFFHWLGRNGKYIANNWKDAVANAKYVPQQLPKRAVFWVIGYLLLNTLLINLMVHMRGPVGTALVFFVLLIAFNLYVLARLVKYLRGLDEIIVASGNDTDVTVNESGLPASLKTLAGNLTVTRETMDKAVAKAVQEERTRTELITNVTHDLKTPLTSLINYSDLLGRKAETKELGDEESVRYIGVIHDQSEKLRHLIDDLLEASKLSTGNVQLNRTTLNLTELAAQAIAEFAPEMEKNGNEIIFTGPDGRPVTEEKLVFADGQKTYRILANLLSNAQKYSAPNTRIYATLSDGAPGKDGQALTTTFELKNTSAAPLNITAEELMERFVRGDRSRGETEGNGLGLSIARDLADLMGGSLALDIDGDLFKATVTLPKHEA